MKFSVRDITSKGVDIERKVPKEGIGLSDEEVDIQSPLHVTAHLRRVDNTIFADTHLEAEFGFLCARCLENVQQRQSRDYEFTFEIEPTVEYIDLGEEIRQEIIVENPTRVLCKPDCKGICAGCGVNLNQEQCKCN